MLCLLFATASVKMGKWHNHSKQQACPLIICKLSNKVDGTTAIAILAINGDFDTEPRKRCWTLQVHQDTLSSRLQHLSETVPKYKQSKFRLSIESIMSKWLNSSRIRNINHCRVGSYNFCIFLPDCACASRILSKFPNIGNDPPKRRIRINTSSRLSTWG